MSFRSKLARLFATIVILSAVACSEFPELASLADNPSNDFTTQSCLASQIAVESATQRTAIAPSRITRRDNLFGAPQRISLFAISRDLLVLYSVFRT